MAEISSAIENPSAQDVLGLPEPHPPSPHPPSEHEDS
jgi:hypothetical protein